MESYYVYSFGSGIFYFMRSIRAVASSSNSYLYCRKLPINEKDFFELLLLVQSLDVSMDLYFSVPVSLLCLRTLLTYSFYSQK